MNAYSFLIEEKGKESSQIFLNPGDVYTFGRDKKCDYPISNSQVSRIQATLKCKNNEVVLVLDGDGDNVSRNGVYDRDGDKISVQKNLNPGEFVWIVMIEDFHVKLKFLENFEEINVDTVTGVSSEEKLLNTVLSVQKDLQQVSERLENYIANSRADIRSIVEKEIIAVDQREGTAKKIEQLQMNVNELQSGLISSNKTNSRQNKLLTGIICGSIAIFGLSGTISKMESSERKEWVELAKNIALICVAGGGGYIATTQKEK